MPPPTIDTFLRLTRPQNPAISTIPHGVAQILERACGEVYALLALAHAEVAACHQPADAEGALYAWEGREPLQLEGSADSRGKMHLVDIRVRGASVSEHLARGLWAEAEEYLQTRHPRDEPAALSRRAAVMDRADEREARAA